MAIYPIMIAGFGSWRPIGPRAEGHTPQLPSVNELTAPVLPRTEPVVPSAEPQGGTDAPAPPTDGD